jgi:hypothetical protein
VNESFLYGTHGIIIQCVYFAILLGSNELGFRLGLKVSAKTRADTRSQIATVEAALLGVLALLLGFTMTLAVSQLENRRQLVVDEANAIGSARFQAQVLPTPEGPEIAALLEKYVGVRVEYGTSGTDLARLASLHTETAQLQKVLWAHAAAYAQKDPNPVKAGLLLQSLNHAFDLEGERWMALHNHVPQSVIFINALVGLLAVTLVGYTFGLGQQRDTFSTCLLALSITLVLAVITDLDRPRTGFIRANQQPMIDLLQER